MSTSDDRHFNRENIVEINAAVAGISRAHWVSLDERASTTEQALETMRQYRFDVLPITSGSAVTGYFQTNGWNDFTSVSRKRITYKDVIPFQTHIRDLIKSFALDSRLFFFLNDENRIVGLVSVANLNCRQVRVYLFNLLSELEIRLGQFLLAHLSEAELLEMTFLGDNADKYESVKKRYKTDRDNGVESPFVDYLYLSDLINIVLKRELHSKLGYEKKEFQSNLGSLNDLRDTVAHPNRSLITSVNTVEQLWRRIDRAEDALFRLRLNQENGA